MSDKERSQADHVYHAWINRRQDELAKAGKQREHSLYEFKSLMHFLQWGGKRIEKAFTGQLPVLHQQCSRCEPEPIPNNVLKCCMGVEVLECDILLSLKATFEEERNRECGVLGKHYSGIPDEEMYRLMAQTCAWHIYKTVTKGQEGWGGIDTSEGHLLDVSDRMFWDRVYSSMADSDPEEEEGKR